MFTIVIYKLATVQIINQKNTQMRAKEFWQDLTPNQRIAFWILSAGRSRKDACSRSL
jgi:hypothetical protein